MSNLQVIERNGQRVLTTSQLASAFGTDTRFISNNFTRNRDRYVEGKHYFVLEGDEKRHFIDRHQIDDASKRANVIYLWTEKGAWMHAKSLNTDAAWNAYEALVDDYYDLKQDKPVVPNAPVDERSVRMELLRTALEHETRIGSIEERVSNVERSLTLDYGEQRSLQKVIARRVCEIEPDSKMRSDLFRQLYREIRDRWGVASYRDVRRVELQEVLNYVRAWKPRMQLVG